jgi:hypothetical protein
MGTLAVSEMCGVSLQDRDVVKLHAEGSHTWFDGSDGRW